MLLTDFTMKVSSSASLMHDAGHSKLVLWDNPEGWGRGFGMRGYMCTCGCLPVADPCQCMAKITIL